MNNLYKKINAVKVKLAALDINKSGHNKFTNFHYYELGDFLPSLIKLMDSEGITSIVSFDREYGYLQIVDIESGDQVVTKSPLEIADIKGANTVQNLGAAQTYLRRYLYMNLFDIVEGEVHDALLNKENTEKPKKEKTQVIQEPKLDQKKEWNLNELHKWIQKAADVEGKTVDDGYKGILAKQDVKKIEDLSNEKLESLIQGLQNKYGGENEK